MVALAPRTVVYAGLGLPCELCGRPAVEFAHTSDGHVYARHEYSVEWALEVKVKGVRSEWVCRIQ